jgi:hypothetical protein
VTHDLPDVAGWTSWENASAYRSYLTEELFPKLQRELASHGYLGYDVLTRPLDLEVEFVTLVWFESLGGVKAFAGEDYETPVVNEKARRLLARHESRCVHLDVAGSNRFDS